MRAEVMTSGVFGIAGGDPKGTKRARENDAQRESAPVSPFVATPPSRAKWQSVSYTDRPEACVGVQHRARAVAAVDTEHPVTRQTIGAVVFRATHSPPASSPTTPRASLFARRAGARVGTSSRGVERLQAETTHARLDLDGDSFADSNDEKTSGSSDLSLISRERNKQSLGVSPCLSIDTIEVPTDIPNGVPNTYLPNSKMPKHGWMQRCFGCGAWTGAAASVGDFEVFRCHGCARGFRERARLMNEIGTRSASSGGPLDSSTRDRTENSASAGTTDLSKIAQKLRAFLAARLPEAGLEHSILQLPR
jgi:hypothetical protein|tara:strand:- start:4427 stop:5347 length:921 start_codon:yes stop_codon:yes gene_type:complete